MKNPVLLRNFFIFFFILLAFVIGLGYHTLNTSREIQASDRRVAHTQQVIINAQKLMTTVGYVISYQRNIVLMKDSNAAPYETSKADMSREISALRVMTADNASQITRITELEHLSLKLKDALDQKIATFKDNYTMPSLSDYDDVIRIRDDMYRLAQDMLDDEYKILNMREQMVSGRIYNYQMSLLIGGIVASIIILIFNWYLLQAQSQISKAEANLKESEERLRLAIRGSNDGIFDWNFKTKQIYWSPQYKEMLGYDDEEIKGDEETFKKLLHPEDADAFWTAFNNYINGSLSEFSCIYRMIHKTGRDVWINGRGKALFDENGHPLRFIGAHTDISYMKEHERQLKEERDRAESASRAKGEFLAHMSHEIRTPLTAISGIAEIFTAANPFIDPGQQKLVKTLRTSTESLKELITDILDFSKIESGEVELYNQKFTLGELFEQVISIMSVKAAEKHLEFAFDYRDVRTTVFYGDKQRMRQILLNLIGNAIKFTETGYVHVKIAIENIAEASVLRMEVEDTGIGIPEGALPHIFDKFRQADSSVSRRYGGSGLGLSISKSLAELMGGTIKVSSEMNRGSNFTFIVPFKSTGEENAVDMDEVLRMQKLNDRLRAAIGEKKKILLVEDYEGNIVVLSFMLNSLNCAFDVARTGLEAVQAWKEKHYDLILMDVQMPEMDGLTASRTIRKMEEEQNLAMTPIIGLTAHALVADKQKCIEAGMNDYLSKPIVEGDLKQAILRLLEPQGRSSGQAA